MRWISLVVLSVAAASAGCGLRPPEVPAPAEPHALELRLAADAPRPGWTAVELTDQPATLHLAPTPVVSTRDFAWVAVDPTPEGLRLDLWLTFEGARRLTGATRENVGRWLAVVANGRVLTAASIAQPVAVETVPVQVALRLDPEEARLLRRQVEAAWPPVPPSEPRIAARSPRR